MKFKINDRVWFYPEDTLSVKDVILERFGVYGGIIKSIHLYEGDKVVYTVQTYTVYSTEDKSYDVSESSCFASEKEAVLTRINRALKAVEEDKSNLEELWNRHMKYEDKTERK